MYVREYLRADRMYIIILSLSCVNSQCQAPTKFVEHWIRGGPPMLALTVQLSQESVAVTSLKPLFLLILVPLLLWGKVM